MAFSGLINAIKVSGQVVKGKNGLLDEEGLKDTVTSLTKMSPKVHDLTDYLTTLREIVATGDLKAGFKEIGNGIKSFVSNNASLLTTSAIVASLVVAYSAWRKFVVDKSANTFANAQNAIQDLQNTESELQSVNSELAETKSRMDELNSKSSLTLVEQDELAQLEAQNDALARRAELLELIKEAQTDTANDAIEKSFTEATGWDDHKGDFFQTGIDEIATNGKSELVKGSNGSIVNQQSGYVNGKYQVGGEHGSVTRIDRMRNVVDYYEEQKQQLEEQNEKLLELTKEGSDKSKKEAEKLKKNIAGTEEAMKTAQTWIEEELSKWAELTNNFDPKTIASFDIDTQTQINDALDAAYNALGTSGKNKTAKIEGSLEKYDGIKDKILALAKDGKLTLEALKQISEEAKTELGDTFLGDMSTLGIKNDEVLDYFNLLANPSGYDFTKVKSKIADDFAKLKDTEQDAANDYLKNISDEELTAYMQIKTDADIDTSTWDLATWKKKIQDKIDEASKGTTFDIKATPKLDAYKAATESANEGANYDTIVSSLSTVKDLYDKGLVGTDDFLSFASFVSPDGIATLAEYEKHIGTIKKYFTEDNTGIENFKKDLDAKGLAEYNAQTGELVTNFKNVDEAASKMGLSTEAFVMNMQKLSEYGYNVNIFNNRDEAKKALDGYIEEYSSLLAKRNTLLDNGTPYNDSEIQALNDKINQLKDDINSASDAYSNLLSGGDGTDTSAQEKAEAISQKLDAYKKVLSDQLKEYNNIDFSQFGENATSVKNQIKADLDTLASNAGGTLVEIDGKLVFNTTEAQQEVQQATQTIQATAPSVTLGVEVEQRPSDDFIGPMPLVSTQDQTVTVNAETDDANGKLNTTTGKVDNLQSKSPVNIVLSAKDGISSKVTSINSSLNSLNGRTITTYMRTIKMPGFDAVNGTAHSNGNARAYGRARINGTWGEPTGGKTLVGELGQEIVVRGDRFFTVGDSGAELFSLQRGDIVFNHLQSRAILNNGYVNSRGKALVSGNARNTVTASTSKSAIKKPSDISSTTTVKKESTTTTTTTTGAKSSSSKSSSDSKSSSSDKKKENTNVYNWWDAYLETLKNNYSHFETELDKLNKQYEDAVERGNDEYAKILQERINKSTKVYAKNFMDGYYDLVDKISENQEALVNLRPEFEGMSTLDIINDSTLGMQIQKDYDDRLAAMDDGDAKDALQKEYDEYKSYIASLQSLYEERASMEENIRWVSDENKLKQVRQAVENYNAGDSTDAAAWAEKIGYDSVEAFVDAWNSGDEDLLGNFKQAIYNDETELKNAITGIEKQISDIDSDMSLFDYQGDVKDFEAYNNLIEQKMDLLHQEAEEYRQAGYDEDSKEIQDRQSQYRELQKDIIDSIKKSYEAQLDEVTAEADAINNSISLTEAQGYEANDNTKRQLIANKELENEILEEEKAQLEAKVEQLVVEGKLKEGSEEYLEYMKDIKEITDSINSNNVDIQGWIKDLDEYDRHVSIFEKTLERISDTYSKLSTLASSAYKSFTNRGNYMLKQADNIRQNISLVNDEIAQLTEEIENSGLSDDILEAIKNGTIDYKSITDQNLSNSIQKVNEKYERLLELQTNSIENAENLASVYKDMFDNVANKYEATFNQIELNSNLLNKAVDMTESKGYLASTKYYTQLESLEKDKLKNLEKEKADLTAAFKEAVASGEIEKYSSAWNEMQSQINDVTSAIWDSNAALLEYENNIRQIEWDRFDYLQDTISQITDETKFLIDLMSYSDLFDDDGNMTDEGLATLGMRGLNYNTYMEQAKKYAEEIAAINEEIADDEYNTDLLDRRQELIKSQRESILAAEEEKEAIKSLVSDGIDAELDALKDLIDKYLDALEAEEDLYDYQKNIKKQAKEVTNLQKQLAAYANDTSEETQAKLQQLKVDLSDAQEELAETQYKQYISDTKKLLNNLYDEYEDNLNDQLDDIDTLIETAISTINSNSSSIAQTIQDVSTEAGYTLSDEMTEIWSPIADGTGEIQNVLTTYSNNMAASMTTLQSTVQNIVTGIDNMISATDRLASSYINSASSDSEEVNTSGGSSSSSSSNTQSLTTTNKNSSSSSSSSSQSPEEQLISMYGSSKVAGTYDSFTEAYNDIGKRGLLSESNPTVYFVHRMKVNGKEKYKYYSVVYGDAGHANYKGILTGAYATGTKYNKKAGEYLVDDGTGEELIARNVNGRVTSLEVGDRVFNAAETGNIAENLEKLTSLDGSVLTPLSINELWDSLGATGSPASALSSLCDVTGSMLNDMFKANGFASDVTSNSNNSVTYNIDNITLPNVSNAEDFYSEIMQIAQKDKNFKGMIQSMTLGEVTGKNSLNKNKYKF